MSAKAVGFSVGRDAVLQLVTVIVGVIVGLTFLFGSATSWPSGFGSAYLAG
ncbi:hypothetical protein [Amycolatopsis sp. lyj-108]|uniref:hypothetical protein n=1 Tax=Amycolatopsis sp. lyj-108 TaxID=2789286 RepID=UPI003978952A